MKRIYIKLGIITYKDIKFRKVLENDLSILKENEILRICHPKGFHIEVQREYIIKSILNNPILVYTDKYIISDPIIGQHEVIYNSKNMAEYINGLLGF